MALYPVRVNPVLSHPQERRVSLRGDWQFCLDPEDRGAAERWFANPDRFTEIIAVPGSWQGQGFGTDAKETLWDFRLDARLLRASYTGTGWYGKAISIPDDWAGQRIFLNFGAVHPSAEVWLDGVRLGENGMPFVPFGFEITGLAQPGKEHWLAVRVHEEARMYGFAYSWQGNWSGLYRDVELTATGESYIDMCWLHPDADKRHLRIHATIGGQRGATARITMQPLTGTGETVHREIEIGGGIDLRLPVPSPLLWSPDNPHLYRIDIAILQDGKVTDALSERTGFVKLSTEGKHFLINDEPYYLRGTGDFVSCPEIGCPDTDRDRWRRKLKTLRDYGYNYVRCQSYVYGPEYYDVADEVGLLVQSEMGMLGGWGGHNQWHVYAWPPPSPQYRPRLREQWNAVVRRDVNHPSANLYCMSNELGGGTLYPRVAWQCYHETKEIKPTAFVIYTDGGYSPDLPCDFVNDDLHVEEKTEMPLIRHEFQWWSSFPDVRLAEKYSGAVRPYAMEIAREAAEKHGIAHVLPEAAEMSNRLQFLEAKGKMEMCRRDNPRLAGICHFNAMDANSSPQGIFTEFYERKYADAPTWRQTNGDTVIMSSLQFDNRCVQAGDTLQCAFSVSDFAHPPFHTPYLTWRLEADGKVLAEDEVWFKHRPYQTCSAGEIQVKIPTVDRPQKAVLHARLRESEREVTNRWDLWLFPAEEFSGLMTILGNAAHTWLKTCTSLPQIPGRTLLTEVLDGTVVDYLHNGGRVILAAGEGLVKPYNPKFGFTLGQYYFTPPANYPPYEDGHDGTIIQQHPLFGDFPHEGFADLQFFRMMDKAPSLPLEPLGLNGADPAIRVMHSYPVGRSLGYLVDAGYGKGRLIICALDLNQAWPEARALLNRLIAYAAGDTFGPGVTLSEEAMTVLMQATAIP
ncbi:MAG: glycoside hydrolase family 2 protein [Armatimonadota bacterium]